MTQVETAGYDGTVSSTMRTKTDRRGPRSMRIAARFFAPRGPDAHRTPWKTKRMMTHPSRSTRA